MKISFEMLGEKQFERELLRAGLRADDARPVLEQIADWWMEWTEEQFITEGRRSSGGWEELAPSTVRSRGGAAHPILVQSGRLMRELTRRTNVHVTDSFAHLSIPDAEDEYGRYHQTGTSKMPQRRPIEFTQADRIRMTRAIQRWVVTGELSL